jgi:hypothetical protein
MHGLFRWSSFILVLSCLFTCICLCIYVCM